MSKKSNDLHRISLEDLPMNGLIVSGISSTQQRPSLGRFAALVNDSIEDTDQDDFLPITQKQFSQVNIKPTKRKLTTTSNVIEKKRSKKSNLFQDVVQTTHAKLNHHSSCPSPPWLDLPIGNSVDFRLQFYRSSMDLFFRNYSTYFLLYSNQIIDHTNWSCMSTVASSD